MEIHRLNKSRKNRRIVILSEAKNLSFFDFAGTQTEERFFALLRITRLGGVSTTCEASATFS
jgi:hypothetical protein